MRTATRSGASTTTSVVATNAMHSPAVHRTLYIPYRRLQGVINLHYSRSQLVVES
jgi:hypothetical protein